MINNQSYRFTINVNHENEETIIILLTTVDSVRLTNHITTTQSMSSVWGWVLATHLDANNLRRR